MLAPADPHQPVQALLLAGAGIDEDVVGRHGPGQDLEHRQLAHVRVGHRLEHEGHGRPVGVARHLHRLARCLGEHRRHLRRRRTDVGDEVGEAVHGDRAHGRAEQHREDHRTVDALVQRPLELFGRGLLALEVALEQRVVLLDHVLHKLLVLLVLSCRDVVGELVTLLGAPGVVQPHVLGDEVGDAVEARLLADGELHRLDARRAEPLPDLAEHPVEVGTVPVHLVHEDEPGDPPGRRRPPQPLVLGLHPGHPVDDEHEQVGDPQRSLHLACEVGVARGVEEVDVVVAPREGQQARRQGLAALALLLLGVRRGGPALHRAHAGAHAGADEQRLGQRGLPRACVPDQGDVSDAVGHWLHGHLRGGWCLPACRPTAGRRQGPRSPAAGPLSPP